MRNWHFWGNLRDHQPIMVTGKSPIRSDNNLIIDSNLNFMAVFLEIRISARLVSLRSVVSSGDNDW